MHRSRIEHGVRVRGLGLWVAFAVAIAGVPVLVFAGPGQGPKHEREFVGLWEGIDPLDGSVVQLSLTDVEGDGILELTQREGFFSVCFDRGAAFSQGRGVIVGTATASAKGVLDLDTQLICIDDEGGADPLPPGDVDQYTLHSHGQILRLPAFESAPPVLLHRIAP